MSSTLYNYQDSEFNLNEAGSYTLLLLASAEYFSYAVVKAGKLMAWLRDCPAQHLHNPSEELNSLLHAGYAQVIVGIESQKFTLWPAALFEPNQLPAMARLLNVELNECVFYDRLDQYNTAVYTAPNALADLIQNYGWESQTTLGAKGWIKAIASNSPSEQSIYINVHKQWVDVLYFRGDKVRLYNKFKFKNAEELVYYTLLTVQELDLDLKVTSVKATGSIQPADPCISRLAEFFKSAEVMTLSVIDLPSEADPNAILTLSALNLCVSLAEV